MYRNYFTRAITVQKLVKIDVMPRKAKPRIWSITGGGSEEE